MSPPEEAVQAVDSFVRWLGAKGYRIQRLPEPHQGECLNFEGQDPEDYTPWDSCYLHIAATEKAQDVDPNRLVSEFWGLNPNPG